MDAAIERADGEWMAAEIQLGSEKLIEQGVNSLLRLRSRVDTARMGEPAALIVITVAGYGFKAPTFSQQRRAAEVPACAIWWAFMRQEVPTRSVRWAFVYRSARL